MQPALHRSTLYRRRKAGFPKSGPAGRKRTVCLSLSLRRKIAALVYVRRSTKAPVDPVAVDWSGSTDQRRILQLINRMAAQPRWIPPGALMVAACDALKIGSVRRSVRLDIRLLVHLRDEEQRSPKRCSLLRASRALRVPVPVLSDCVRGLRSLQMLKTGRQTELSALSLRLTDAGRERAKRHAERSQVQQGSLHADSGECCPSKVFPLNRQMVSYWRRHDGYVAARQLLAGLCYDDKSRLWERRPVRTVEGTRLERKRVITRLRAVS
jgi:hypothetical protein